MKHLLSLLFVYVISFSIMQAQVPPQAFNYSAVARNPLGQPIANSTIGIQINIIKSSTTGVSQYMENHFVNTDNFGLFNLIVGAGAVQSGSMSSIDWGSDDFYLRVGMDANGGTNFLTMGTTQLMSVPYALHAATADSIIGGGGSSSGITIDAVSATGDTLFLSNGQFFVSGVGGSGGSGLLPTLTTFIDTNDIEMGYIIAGGTITNLNGNQIADRGVVLSNSPAPVITPSSAYSMGSGVGVFTDTVSLTGFFDSLIYVRAYAITSANDYAYGNEIVFNWINPIDSGVYVGDMSGQISIPLTGTDANFNNTPTSCRTTKTVLPGIFDFSIDISAVVGASSGVLVPVLEGTLSGSTLTITNQPWTYAGIANSVINGTVNFTPSFNNILNTSSLTFSGDVSGIITFDGVRQ